MENASKALLIAGAVLIVILLIGLGILIYSRSTGVVDTATGIAHTQEIQAFNAQFTGYEGKQKGSSVKTLVSTIIANNANNSIHFGGSWRSIINVIYTPKGNRPIWVCTIDDISSYVSPNIDTSKTYVVTFTEYREGLIYKINITEQ